MHCRHEEQILLHKITIQRPREEGEIRQNHRISSTMKNAGSWNPPGPRQGARAPEEAKRNLLKTTPKTVDAYEYLLDKHLFI